MARLVLAAAVNLLLFVIPAGAMPMAEFDKLSLEDQSNYLVALKEGARQFLLSQGKKDLAAKIVTVFDTPQPGKKFPEGLWQLDKDMDAARQYQQKSGRTVHVEHVLLLTFSKYRIDGISREVMMKVGATYKATQ